MVSVVEQFKRGLFVVAVFAVIGFGIGLTAYFPISYLHKTFSGGFVGPILSAVVGLQSVLLVVFVAPVVAGIAGLFNGYSESNPWAASLTAGSGAFVGFYVMLLFAGLLVIGGFGAGPVAEPTPSPIPSPEPTPTPSPPEETPIFTIETVEIETATPFDPERSLRGGMETVAIGGVPAAIVGALTAAFGYWFRKHSE